MNIPNMNLLVRQMHAALKRVQCDTSSVIPLSTTDGTHFYCEIDFSATMPEEEIENAVSQFIENIAHLKDALKVWCGATNAAFNGDTLINSNRDVGIIHDLWNRRKHFDPYKSRTGLYPRLENVKRTMQLQTGGNVNDGMAMFLTLRREGDKFMPEIKFDGQGTSSLVIHADVVDQSGSHLGTLLGIAEKAINAWKSEMQRLGIPLS